MQIILLKFSKFSGGHAPTKDPISQWPIFKSWLKACTYCVPQPWVQSILINRESSNIDIHTPSEGFCFILNSYLHVLLTPWICVLSGTGIIWELLITCMAPCPTGGYLRINDDERTRQYCVISFIGTHCWLKRLPKITRWQYSTSSSTNQY